jgi:ubiquitin-conjugating enzyme E2 S
MSTGAICVNTLKKDWNPETTFSHVLSVIRCLLIVPFPESSLNDEAGKLFMESYGEYSKRAHLMADVHGRPFSSAEGDEKRQKTEALGADSEDKESSSPRRKSRIESGNPLCSKNGNSISSSGKTLGEKKPSVRMTKKKSLKRL